MIIIINKNNKKLKTTLNDEIVNLQQCQTAHITPVTQGQWPRFGTLRLYLVLLCGCICTASAWLHLTAAGISLALKALGWHRLKCIEKQASFPVFWYECAW